MRYDDDEEAVSVDIQLSELNKEPPPDPDKGPLQTLLDWKYTPLAGAVLGVVLGVIAALLVD